MRDANIREAEIIHRLANFLRKILPESTSLNETKKKTLEQRPKILVIDIGGCQPRHHHSDLL